MRVRQFGCAALLLAAWPFSGGAQPLLWQEPGTITVSDWVWGSGGEARAPKPPFEFEDEDPHGTNPKIRVRDARGDRWTVKFGGENHSEVFASRLLYAVGYWTQPNYYVARGTISGVHGLKRAKPFIGRDGSFRFARFKLRDHKTWAPIDGAGWAWNDNPFVGTQQLNGLKVLMMLTSNWDGKDARDGQGTNTAVYSKSKADSAQRFYSFDDWGASMGKWGGFFERDKWNPGGFAQQSRQFARPAPGGGIEWGYKGKHDPDIVSGISPDDVRWLLTYLSRVSDDELRAGLEASGATGAETGIYTRSIRERITQLQRLTGFAAPTVTSAKRGND